MSGMGRREALAFLLGSPWLLKLSGCGTGAARPLPPGKIVGESEEFCHLLRSPPAAAPPERSWLEADAIIVGGGVAGLSAAWRLDHAGLRNFVLIELDDALGGASRSGRDGTVPYPWAAHYIPAPRKGNRALTRLLDEMGVVEGTDENGEPIVAEQCLCRDPDERIFCGGKWHEGLFPGDGASAGDLRQFRALQAEVDRWVAWRDARGRRAFDLPIAACSDDADAVALDRRNAADWLDSLGISSPRVRWYVEYACRDDYGSRLQDTSAWAAVFYFASRMKSPGAEAQPLIVWPEGNGRLVQHLARRAGSRAMPGWMATNIVPAETADGLAEVWAMNAREERVGIRARRIIFAAPQFLAKFVIGPYRENPPAHLSSFEYVPWMVANLHLRDRPRERGLPLCWDNVLYDSPGLGYVVATHQTEQDRGPTVFTYYCAMCDGAAKDARKKLLDVGRDGWAEFVFADLGRAHPDLARLTERLDVMRWGHAMIRPKPGFLWGQDRKRAREPFRGIHFANTDLSGVALFEEAFYHGVRSAEEVLHAMRRPVPDPWAVPA